MTRTLDIDQLDFDKGGGLVPTIVQDAADGRVLMLAYMNREALTRTLETGQVTLYSRSRKRLWTKGETSGNRLELAAIAPDCDGDALLVQAVPLGPACHTGTDTCFGDTEWPAVGFIARLERIIAKRRHADPETSYTARLFGQGIDRLAQKVGEEGVETALAAARGDTSKLSGEAADLLYHLLVCLQASGLDIARVSRALRARRKDGGSSDR